MAEIILQVTAQSIAHRLWRYAQTRAQHHFYPAGFCDTVNTQNTHSYVMTRREKQAGRQSLPPPPPPPPTLPLPHC